MKKTKRHISDSRTDGHNGVNGFDMDKTIEVKNDETGLEMHEKLKRAANRVDTISTKTARKVADKAGVSEYRVLRVWYDMRKDIKHFKKTTTINWKRASDKQRYVLAHKYMNPDASFTDFQNDDSVPEVSRDAYYKTIQNYGFILEDRYSPENFEEMAKRWLDDEPEKSNTDDTSSSTPDIEEDDKERLMNTDMALVLNELDIEHEVEINIKEDDFEVMKKMIKNGYDELAEEFYNE